MRVSFRYDSLRKKYMMNEYQRDTIVIGMNRSKIAGPGAACTWQGPGTASLAGFGAAPQQAVWETAEGASA